MPEVRRAKHFRGKCIICGDSTVGKSALTQVFCSDGTQYPKMYQMTTGVDMVVKNVNIPGTSDTVEMFLYDLAGKELFDDIIQHHIPSTQMIMFIYDVSNIESFNNMEEWHKKVKACIASDKDIPSVLVANKIDLVDRQVVTPEEGKLLSEKLNMEFFECSAKEVLQVDVPFLQLAAAFYEKEVESIHE